MGSMLRLRAAREFASSAVCLMLPSNKMYRLEERKVVNMNIEKELESDSITGSVSVVGSSHGWVGLMKDRTRSSRLSVWNPASGSRIKLPPIPQHPNCRLDVERLVIDGANGDCIHAIIVGFSQWLGVYYPGGGGCSEWSLFGRNKQYLDVVACSHRRVYSLDANNRVARWDISDCRRPRRDWEKDLEYHDQLGYDDKKKKKKFPSFLHLVYAEHTNQLFLVTRHYSPHVDKLTIAFDVHLLVENETTGEAEAVRCMDHTLDGLVMFVGINNAFAVAAADFPHLKPDSIYFTDQATHIPHSNAALIAFTMLAFTMLAFTITKTGLFHHAIIHPNPTPTPTPTPTTILSGSILLILDRTTNLLCCLLTMDY